MMPQLTDVEKTILAEAAGEGEEGMYGVASTILNRARLRQLTPEQVVNEPKQFSGRFRPDLEVFVAKQPPQTIEAMRRAWARAIERPLDATHFLTSDLYHSLKRPTWAESMRVVDTIGNHVFLRESP